MNACVGEAAGQIGGAQRDMNGRVKRKEVRGRGQQESNLKLTQTGSAALPSTPRGPPKYTFINFVARVS